MPPHSMVVTGTCWAMVQQTHTPQNVTAMSGGLLTMGVRLFTRRVQTRCILTEREKQQGGEKCDPSLCVWEGGEIIKNLSYFVTPVYILMRSTRAGPWFWRLLHATAHCYTPLRDARRVRALLYSVADLFPCRYCRRHYRGHLRANPPQLHSRDALVKWMHRLHNRVNDMLHKPRASLTHAREYGLKQSERLPQIWGVVGIIMASGIVDRRATPNKIKRLAKMLQFILTEFDDVHRGRAQTHIDLSTKKTLAVYLTSRQSRVWVDRVKAWM